MNEVVATGSKPGIPGMECSHCGNPLRPGDQVEVFRGGYVHITCAVMARADRRMTIMLRLYVAALVLSTALVAWMAGRA